MERPGDGLISSREAALERELAGRSSEVGEEEARRAVEAAALDRAARRSGLGFGLTMSWPGASGEDRLRLRWAVTDGHHAASIDVFVSASRQAELDATGADVLAWAHRRLQELARRHRRAGDPYRALAEAVHLMLID